MTYTLYVCHAFIYPIRSTLLSSLWVIQQMSSESTSPMELVMCQKVYWIHDEHSHNETGSFCYTASIMSFHFLLEKRAVCLWSWWWNENIFDSLGQRAAGTRLFISLGQGAPSYFMMRGIIDTEKVGDLPPYKNDSFLCYKNNTELIFVCLSSIIYHNNYREKYI